MKIEKAKRTMDELRFMQSAPLNLKIALSRDRIRQWVNEFGESGVYVSFSGGKDSTVLLHLVRHVCGYRRVPAVFVDVPTQYPELKTFAQKYDNLAIVKPKISFMQVCDKYGFPLISKEVSECIQGASKYLRSITDRQTDLTTIGMTESIAESEELANLLNDRMKNRKGGSNQRLAIMLGMLTKNQEIKANIPKEDRSNYSLSKYKFFLDAPFEVSNKCCDVMKKNPASLYTQKTGRLPITGQMAVESHLRTQKWLQHGCNMFDAKHPKSNPMSFWTEQDVLQYIVQNDLEICSVYGDIVEDYDTQGQVEGQTCLADFGFEMADRPLKCTGCQRTGCMLCGFGCHLEKEPRFQLLHKTHPKMYALLDVVKNNGVTFREAIEWTNEHGNLNIKL